MRDENTWPWAWAIIRRVAYSDVVQVEEAQIIGPYFTKADAEADAGKMHGAVVRMLLPHSDSEEDRLKARNGPPFEK